jgi:hypothetical protein
MYAITSTTPKTEERVVPWNKGKLVGQERQSGWSGPPTVPIHCGARNRR